MRTALVFNGEPRGFTNSKKLVNNNILRDYINPNYHGQLDIHWMFRDHWANVFSKDSQKFITRDGKLVRCNKKIDQDLIRENIKTYCADHPEKVNKSIVRFVPKRDDNEGRYGNYMLECLDWVKKYDLIIWARPDMYLGCEGNPDPFLHQFSLNEERPMVEFCKTQHPMNLVSTTPILDGIKQVPVVHGDFIVFNQTYAKMLRRLMFPSNNLTSEDFFTFASALIMEIGNGKFYHNNFVRYLREEGQKY